MNQTFFLLLFFLTVLSSCGSNAPTAEGNTNSTLAPSPQQAHLYATLVAKKGEVVMEEYYNGQTPDSLSDVQSLTKGLMSILIGIAIDKGHIESVDEPIIKYLPKRLDTLSAEKQAITIRHLLNQTSGLLWKGYLEHEAWMNSEDPIGYVLNKPLIAPPGTEYNYNSGATHLLSVILSEATASSTLQFANKHLFDDLQINQLAWTMRKQGYYDGSGLGLKMKPQDLLKIGELLAARGQWNGKQLISEEWINAMFDEANKRPTDWGLPNSTHGYCWYKANFQGLSIDYGMGYGGQFIILIPEKELVIVATHNHDTPDGIDHQIAFLHRQLPQLIASYTP